MTSKLEDWTISFNYDDANMEAASRLFVQIEALLHKDTFKDYIEQMLTLSEKGNFIDGFDIQFDLPRIERHLAYLKETGIILQPKRINND